jgi:hypothetical protein
VKVGINGDYYFTNDAYLFPIGGKARKRGNLTSGGWRMIR